MSEAPQPSAKTAGGGTGKVIAVVVVTIILVAVVAAYFLTTKTTMKTTTTVIVSIPKGVSTNHTLNFSPSTITVVIGTNNTIRWMNQDSALHTVTSTSVPIGANPFDSGNLNAGSAYVITLNVTGTYQYHCTFHPIWMIGTIVAKSG